MTGQRILIVEDEEALGDLVAEGLRRHGFSVERASDGDTALDMAETVLPDLILLDLMLPKMDGWEVCRRLRSAPATRDIPVLMLTARRDEKDVVAGLELGADDTCGSLSPCPSWPPGSKPFCAGRLGRSPPRRSSPKVP